MASPRQYVVLQKEAAAPSPEQLKRAFRSFSNLTDADAVRLAISAQGILLRQVSRDEARAFQQALQAEGVGTAVSAEDDLPKLPDARLLHRMELSPAALITYDVIGRAKSIPWTDIALMAAGAVQHVGISRSQTERSERGLTSMAMWAKTTTEFSHKMQAESQLLLDILLTDRTTRYQIEAARFPFKYVINEPSLSPAEKFSWLVRELCRHAPAALLNGGARWLRAGHDPVPGYATRQTLADEMVWLLWQAAQADRTP